jgi:hypothetical protein
MITKAKNGKWGFNQSFTHKTEASARTAYAKVLEQERNDFDEFIVWKNTGFTKRGDGKVLRRYERRLVKHLRTLWAKQEQYIIENLDLFFVEENHMKNFVDPNINVVLSEMPEKENIAKAIVATMQVSMARGAKSSIKQLDLGQFGISYNLKNKESISFLSKKLSHELSDYRGNINKTTTDRIGKIINTSVEKGMSAGETAELIRQQGKAGVFSVARGEMIAITETGRAYGKGSRIPIDEFKLTNPTRPVLKLWQTAGDDRVRPSHRANASQGWIPYEATHTGTDEKFAPSMQPRCRCAEKFNIPAPE